MKPLNKRVKIWCKACDISLVSLGTKCKNCGVRNPYKNLRSKELVYYEHQENRVCDSKDSVLCPE